MADLVLGLTTHVFETLDSFIQAVNITAGEDKWYIAGGCAAWLQIDAYANKETKDYAAFNVQIAPGDIEGGVSEAGATALHERYGEMKVRVNERVLDVSLYAKPAEQLQAQVDLCVHFLLNTNPILLISPRNLITAYSTSSNPDKQEKRQLRVAIMTLMTRYQRITKESVGDVLNSAKPSIGQSLSVGLGGLGAFKLKHVDQNK